ncbi:hypothetical protein JD844_011845 [Phrynosoma platyrhinos]|uniref:Uncharacterized protein n=1 Tax=Phrynosoma platyrhinos TaxID=52577 RepID=A0ABQ7TIL2_PHRPL|nr:hypothetical protein JD844_011845 [Phrynosoma platyrhinos]
MSAGERSAGTNSVRGSASTLEGAESRLGLGGEGPGIGPGWAPPEPLPPGPTERGERPLPAGPAPAPARPRLAMGNAATAKKGGEIESGRYDRFVVIDSWPS